jgi:putative membrane protein
MKCSYSFLLALAAGLLSFESPGFAAAVNGTDSSFLKNAYQDGLAEVKMGQMGQAKTGNPDVKALANMIVEDHSKANAQMKALADSKQVKVADEPGMTAEAKSKMLDGKTGGDFEKEYIEALIKDHKTDIDKFEKEAAKAKDPDIKNFVDQTLPTLKHHLEMAEQIQAKIGK